MKIHLGIEFSRMSSNLSLIIFEPIVTRENLKTAKIVINFYEIDTRV